MPHTKVVIGRQNADWNIVSPSSLVGFKNVQCHARGKDLILIRRRRAKKYFKGVDRLKSRSTSGETMVGDDNIDDRR